jgi:hypothetical protein
MWKNWFFFQQKYQKPIHQFVYDPTNILTIAFERGEKYSIKMHILYDQWYDCTLHKVLSTNEWAFSTSDFKPFTSLLQLKYVIAYIENE